MESKLYTFAYVSLIIANIIVICALFSSHYLNVLKYVDYNRINLDEQKVNVNDDEFAIKMVNEAFAYPIYHLSRASLSDCSGYSRLISRQIVIERQLSTTKLILVLTHELVHLIYFTDNERFVQYKTFCILYESGNETLRAIAMNFAREMITYNIYPKAYDCGYYILKYLNLT